MPTSCRPYEPDQVMLLPAAPQDWLPAGHLAHFINDTVDALDLKAFFARCEGGGSRNQPLHPAMMVKVLVYAYATGAFSSRKIERRLHEDLAFRMLAAGNFPRHRTICDFRAFHLKELSELFVQVVRLGREMGLVKLGTVAIDGTKVKANASHHKAMSYERMKQAEIELKAQIDALLARAKATDESEANEPELDLPAEIERRETRLAAIREARERLEQRQREADLQRGRSDDDDRRPRRPDGKPKGGRYKREFSGSPWTTPAHSMRTTSRVSVSWGARASSALKGRSFRRGAASPSASTTSSISSTQSWKLMGRGTRTPAAARRYSASTSALCQAASCCSRP
jgi:transposase